MNGFESILQRMLDRVPNTVDKREGSIIYDALAPAAAELAQMYIEHDLNLNLAFVDTSSGEILTRLCKQFGIIREDASKAIRKGIFKNADDELFNVAIGSRFTLENTVYCVIEKISDGTFKLECEAAGVIGNIYFGALTPVEYISGLASATLEDVLIPGEEIETDDSLKERYFEAVGTPSFGGNIADYKKKTKSINGVGSVKVYPCWNGGGTVKLVLLNSEYEVASQTLVDTVQEIIDPQPQQTGLGVAPIGHLVTVESAIGEAININATVSLQSGYDINTVKENVKTTIESYFNTLAKTWEDNTLTVRIAYIESNILSVEGVLDISGVTINDGTSNIALDDNAIPILGTLEVTI